CLAPSTDSQNCGGLGLACPAGSVCYNGLCTFPDGGSLACPPPLAFDVGSFATRCAVGSCTGEPDNLPCVGGDFCCNGNCIDDDTGDCGGCGVVCNAGAICAGLGFS